MKKATKRYADAHFFDYGFATGMKRIEGFDYEEKPKGRTLVELMEAAMDLGADIDELEYANDLIEEKEYAEARKVLKDAINAAIK